MSIPKQKKPPGNLNSYHPISLKSILAKTMERKANSRLNWYPETQNLLSPAQAGFHAHHTTTQQTLKLSQ